MAHTATARTLNRKSGQSLPASPPRLVPELKGKTPAARGIEMLRAVTPFRHGATLTAIDAAHRADSSGGTRLMTIAGLLTGMDLTSSTSRELLALERELRDAVNRQCDDDVPQTSWYLGALRWIESQRTAVNGRAH